MISICKHGCPAIKCKTGIWNCPKCPDRKDVDAKFYVKDGRVVFV